MIKIITGPINSGKSSWLLKDYKKKTNADGFASVKVRVNGEHIGYDLIHLNTGDSCQFIRKPDFIPEKWNEAFRLGMHYSFNQEGFDLAQKITDEALLNKTKCFYIDEVAHLELKGQGFANILRRILDSKIDLVLVVREHLVEKICDSFHIKEYEIIKPTFD